MSRRRRCDCDENPSPELIQRFWAAVECIEAVEREFPVSIFGGREVLRAIPECCMRYRVDPCGVVEELNARTKRRRKLERELRRAAREEKAAQREAARVAKRRARS